MKTEKELKIPENEMENAAELSEKELEAVSGGYDWGRTLDFRNESDVDASCYDYKVGEIVYVYDGWCFGTCAKRQQYCP